MVGPREAEIPLRSFFGSQGPKPRTVLAKLPRPFLASRLGDFPKFRRLQSQPCLEDRNEHWRRYFLFESFRSGLPSGRSKWIFELFQRTRFDMVNLPQGESLGLASAGFQHYS